MLRFFAKRLKELQEVERDERGFTLIELLVVIIIIGVLAAIAIPTFLNQREKAWQATAQSDLRNAAGAATSCSADQDGDYTGCEPANLGPFGFNKSQHVVFSDLVATPGQWAATATYDLDDGTLYRFDTDDPDANLRGQVYCIPGSPDC